MSKEISSNAKRRVSFDSEEVSNGKKEKSSSAGKLLDEVLSKWTPEQISKVLTDICDEHKDPEARLVRFGLACGVKLDACKPSILVNFNAPMCFLSAESKKGIQSFFESIPQDETTLFIASLLNNEQAQSSHKLMLQFCCIVW